MGLLKGKGILSFVKGGIVALAMVIVCCFGAGLLLILLALMGIALYPQPLPFSNGDSMVHFLTNATTEYVTVLVVGCLSLGIVASALWWTRPRKQTPIQ